MHLVDEEDGPLIVQRPTFLGVGHRCANLSDAGKNGVERAEVRRRRVGDNLGKRCLARSGRPIEYKTAQLVRLNRAAQESSRPYNRFLADELIECARPHARG